MALTKDLLGNYLELQTNTNSKLEYCLEDVRGVNNLKQLMPTKADLNGRDLSKFQIVYPGEFVFNHRTSRNGSKFSIAYNDGINPIICTEDYVVFRIKDEYKKKLSDIWLYMFFNRPEFDRYVITNSWGSSTEFYNWDDIKSIELEIPPYNIQEKYVEVYNSMIENQKSYERGLDDLKLTCDAFIEELRRNSNCEKIKNYIEERKEKNINLISQNVLGISKEGFIPPKQDAGDLHNYWIFKKEDFVYSPPRINVGSIGLYTEEQVSICSPIYVVFHVKDKNKLLSDYLNIWLHREQFFRSTDYYSIGSVRNNFSYDLLCEVSIPIPSIEIQKSVADIYNSYILRKSINEKLKSQIKDICPILIKGSLEEAKEA